MSQYLTKESLSRSPEIHEIPIKDIGIARIRELPRSASQKFEMWLRPNGKVSAKRFEHHDLKLLTLCLLNEDETLMFEFDDSPEGNRDFEKFAKEVDEQADSPWRIVTYHVMVVNGYIDKLEESKELLGKSDP